jgi:MSHA biogenesis protein MshP
MTPRPTLVPRRDAGVGIVTAIFLLVVLAGLGVAMVGLFTAQQTSSILDLQGARAYQAARAGMEWGLFQRTRNGQCAAMSKVPMPAGTTLSGFTVVVSCVQSGNAAVPQFRLSAVACNLADSDGNCNCDNGADASVKPSAACAAPVSADSVSRKIEAQL